MADIDVTVVVDTLVDKLGTGSGQPLRLQRQGFSHENRVELQLGDDVVYVNLSSLRDAVKILGAA